MNVGILISFTSFCGFGIVNPDSSNFGSFAENSLEAGARYAKSAAFAPDAFFDDKLLQLVDRRTTMPEALKKADEVLQQAVQGITDLINIPGLINLDFADVQTVMKDKGIAHIGIGNATGDDKAIDAMKIAVSSPLLETTIEGATNVLINIAGDVSLPEVHEAASYVQELAGEDANIIFGATYDENATDEVTITVIATGVEDKNLEGVQAQSSKKGQIICCIHKKIKVYCNHIYHPKKKEKSHFCASLSYNFIYTLVSL